MFFAFWCSPSRPLADVVSARVDRPGAVRVGGSNAGIAAWPPARLVQHGRIVTAHAAFDPSGGSLPGHPSAQLDERTLTIAAGPLPQYPLYYTITAGRDHIVACSQLEPLARLFPDAPLDAHRLVSLIAYGDDTDSSATVYAGIRRMRPGETIVAEGNLVRVVRDFPRIGLRYRTGKVQDLAAELRYRLGAAVERATRGAKRVAVFASGGLDSSGVLALAAAQCRGLPAKAVDAISVQYAGPGDDRPYFAELTVSLGIDPLLLRPQEAAPWFRRSLCMDGQPGNLASTCLFLLQGARAVERGADVVLTGVGGDSICGGLLPFSPFANWTREGRVLAAINGALRLRIPWPMGPWLRMRYALSPLVPDVARRLKRRFSRRKGASWLTPRSRSLLEDCREADESAAEDPPASPDAGMKFLCTQCQLTDGADVLGQLGTVTGCFPVDVFLDEDFVRFMLELDPALLNHGHEFRGLYRLAMKGILPERLRRRQDKGIFEPAVAAAAAPSGLEALRDLASLKELASRGLADPTPLRRDADTCFAMVERGERAHDVSGDEWFQRFWQLLSAEAFLRECGRGREIS
jgi:asparagine synthetase B (glutamine-hydrolysing)